MIDRPCCEVLGLLCLTVFVCRRVLLSFVFFFFWLKEEGRGVYIYGTLRDVGGRQRDIRERKWKGGRRTEVGRNRERQKRKGGESEHERRAREPQGGSCGHA